MTDDELAKELHELKRRNQTPKLIETFDALLSLDPRLSAKQKRKRFDFGCCVRITVRSESAVGYTATPCRRCADPASS